MAQLLHDDLVYVHSHGKTDGRAEYLEALAAGTWSYDAIEHPVTVEEIDGRTALAVGRMTASGTAYGRAVEVVSVTMSVWSADDDGRWQLRAFQSTKAPTPRGD